jgi:threonine/homoserine/homoserine lactone efflux protein
MEPLALTALFVASTVNAAFPGPCMILTVGRTARGGLRSGLRVSVGVLLGDVVLVGLAVLAMLGTLTLGHRALSAMKWGGALVLLVIAARMLRAGPERPAGTARRTDKLGDVVSGAMLGVSSPFNLVFMLALLPQFIPPDGMDAGVALLIAGGFLAGVLVAQAGATLVGAGSLRLVGGQGRWLDYAGAAALIGFAGIALLAPLD